MKKECIIKKVNDTFEYQYQMFVDSFTINFSGIQTAEYFKNIYTQLGYEIFSY